MKSRSLLRRVRQIASVLILSIWVTELGQAQPPKEVHQLTSEEQVALARTLVLETVAQQLATDSAQDYYPFLQSRVVINDAKQHMGIAVGFKSPPAGFVAMKQSWTADPVSYGPLGENFGYANTSLIWNGQRITTYRVDAVGDADEDGALRLRLMFHEAGHTFAYDNVPASAKFAAHASFGFVYPIYDAENSGLAQLEAKLLIAAYQQRGSSKALMQIARKFVAIRQLRYARLNPTLVVFEQDNEINEGLAEYFGKSALRRWLASDVKLEPSLAAVARLGDLASAEQGTNAQSVAYLEEGEKVRLGLTREWAYHTGPAIGYMLDAVSPGWLRQLARSSSATLWEVFRSAVALQDADAVKLVGAVKARYDWSSLLAAEKQAQQKRKIQHEHMIADLEQGEGTVICIEMAPVLTDENRQFYFDPRGIVNVGEGREIYPNFAELKAEPDYDAKVDRKVLVDKVRGTLLTRLPPPTQLSVTASGLPVTLTDNSQAYKDLHIVGDSIDVHMRSASAIMRNNRLTLTATR